MEKIKLCLQSKPFLSQTKCSREKKNSSSYKMHAVAFNFFYCVTIEWNAKVMQFKYNLKEY